MIHRLDMRQKGRPFHRLQSRGRKRTQSDKIQNQEDDSPNLPFNVVAVFGVDFVIL